MFVCAVLLCVISAGVQVLQSQLPGSTPGAAQGGVPEAVGCGCNSNAVQLTEPEVCGAVLPSHVNTAKQL